METTGRPCEVGRHRVQDLDHIRLQSESPPFLQQRCVSQEMAAQHCKQGVFEVGFALPVELDPASTDHNPVPSLQQFSADP